MFLVDMEEGRIIDDTEVKQRLLNKYLTVIGSVEILLIPKTFLCLPRELLMTSILF